MQFKTNAKCSGCASKILDRMHTEFPDEEWSLDLDSVDKVLENHGIPDNTEKAAQVLKALEETGFKGTWLPQSGY